MSHLMDNRKGATEEDLCVAATGSRSKNHHFTSVMEELQTFGLISLKKSKTESLPIFVLNNKRRPMRSVVKVTKKAKKAKIARAPSKIRLIEVESSVFSRVSFIFGVPIRQKAGDPQETKVDRDARSALSIQGIQDE